MPKYTSKLLKFKNKVDHLTLVADNGEIFQELWYFDGEHHKDDGPALIKYHFLTTHKPALKVWYHKGYTHRVDGPAVFVYDINGKIKSEHWLINSCKIDKQWLFEHGLFGIEYEDWSVDMKLLFKLTWS